jgi:hypothetical protein
MRTEEEIRSLLHYYIAENEGGIDPFADVGMEPREDMCLWCVRIRLLKWALGELNEPDNGMGMAKYGMAWNGDSVPAPPRDPALVERVLAGEDNDP